MISHVHHINFIVHDLDKAIARYQNLLGLNDFQIDSLEKRGVITARKKLGNTWLILVQPTNRTGKPAQYLKQHGEGFFLMSLATDDLDVQTDKVKQHYEVGETRQGLENWAVTDLPRDAFFGAQIQLTQEK